MTGKLATGGGPEDDGPVNGSLLALPILFSATTFGSAALLFMVQPMAARMLLPLFGGAAAVWTTCLLFYQGVLLLGYLYAHGLSARFSPAAQLACHMAVLGAAALVLPLHVDRGVALVVAVSPVPALLWALSKAVGLPLFALSGTGTLVQSWFARTHHRWSADPYFLYAVSNLGSLLALLAYPLLIEPRVGLLAQSRGWAWTFVLVAGFVGLCGRRLLQAPGGSPGDLAAPVTSGLSWGQRLRWTWVAAIPSSLMMAVTLHLTTDIAPVPLLWVVPLCLYLLAFVAAFARLPAGLFRLACAMAAPALLVVLFFLLSQMRYPIGLAFLLHLGALFLVCLCYLGHLGATRPPPRHLTAFYFWLALGGVLGGAFNALMAPFLFKTVAEYPILLITAAVLLPVVRPAKTGVAPRVSFAMLAAEGSAAAGISLLCAWLVSMPLPLGRLDLAPVGDLVGLPRWRITLALTYAIPLALCWLCHALGRHLAFALGLAAVAIVCVRDNEAPRRVVVRSRSFFSVLTVADDPEGDCRHLFSGAIPHGRQLLDPASRGEPLAFYLRRGPIGDVFAELGGRHEQGPVAIVGLGTGTLAAYGQPGQRMTFYEIDPSVARVAQDPALFTYLADSRAEIDVVLGDARLRLQEATAGRYGLVVIDAFSSDAIPVHLLTREAIALYLDKLAPDGLLALHISNRYLDLGGVLGRLAQEAGLAARVRSFRGGDGCATLSTRWVVMARDEASLGSLATETAWERLEVPPEAPLWTDDFSNVVTLLLGGGAGKGP